MCFEKYTKFLFSRNQNLFLGQQLSFFSEHMIKGAFFSPPLGLLGNSDHILQNICLKLGRGFIFGPYAHFLLMKFFSKNLKFFFDFLKIQRGDPLDKKKSKKFFKLFEKKFINKKCAYAPKKKPRPSFRQIF